MQTSDRTRLFVLLFVLAAAAALSSFTGRGNEMTGARTSAQTNDCGCDNIEAVACKKATPPPKSSPTRKKSVVQPVVIPPIGSAEPIKIYPPTGDPAFDHGSGTGPNDEHTYDLGKANSSGHFAERRRYIYNTVKFGEAAYQNGEISADSFNRLKSVMKDRLNEVNAQEDAAYPKAGTNEAIQEQARIIEREIDPQNEARTKAALKEIEQMNIENFGDYEGTIEQAIVDNLGQARAQELLGSNGKNAFERARQIINALRDKFAKDCDKSRVAIQTVLGVERAAQLMGAEASADIMARCFTVTAIAKASFRGIEYEARKCITVGIRQGRQAFVGDWMIKISGAMSGTGEGTINDGGSGDWSGNATAGGGALISMTGPIELISGGGKCALKLTSSMGVGTAAGYTVSMPGVSGELPITVVPEVCTVKEARP